VSSVKSQEKTVEDTHSVSVCDVMRNNTNEVIMRIEGLLPSYIESFADLQAEGLRITRDFFGTCYIAEKEILDKMGVDQKAIETFDRYSKIITKAAVSEIDMMSSFQRTWTENMISSMKSYDDYVKAMLSSYAKVLEYTSALIPKKT